MLKDINKNELTSDQLNNVNGGTMGETRTDSKLLCQLGLLDEEYDNFDLTFHWGKCSSKVDDAWKKVGITSVTRFDFRNTYIYQGKTIEREKAHEIAKAAFINGPKIR